MDRGDRAWTAQDAHFQGLPVKHPVISPTAVPGVAYAWSLQGVPGMSVSERVAVVFLPLQASRSCLHDTQGTARGGGTASWGPSRDPSPLMARPGCPPPTSSVRGNEGSAVL